jgi:glucokinase
MVRYVAGDIGGTNSRLHLMELVESKEGDELGELDENRSSFDEILVAEEVYPSQHYSSLTFIVQKFLAKYVTDNDYPVAACLVVAGPVRANKSVLTNVNWTLDGDQMAVELNMRSVRILNDFVGIGYGLLALKREHVIPINDVPMTDQAPKACLGAGTGLGETYLTWTGSEYDVFASEGGHADFAPRDETEFRLLEFLLKTERATRVSVERVVSGMGIPKIYDYFCTLYPQEVKEEVSSKIRTSDPGAVIAQYAQSGKCQLCVRTIKQFVRSYGAEAGNLALKMLPFGGLYIAGGIAPKLLWALQDNHEFYNNFVNKGRMRSILERIPVHIVIHKQPGLLGAKVVCRRQLRSGGFSMTGEISHFPESSPRGLLDNLDNILTAGTDGDVEHELETRKAANGTTVSKVVVRRAKKRAQQQSLSNNSRPNSPNRRVNGKNSEQLNDKQLIRSAVYGGLIASVATVVISTLLNKFLQPSATLVIRRPQ